MVTTAAGPVLQTVVVVFAQRNSWCGDGSRLSRMGRVLVFVRIVGAEFVSRVPAAFLRFVNIIAVRCIGLRPRFTWHGHILYPIHHADWKIFGPGGKVNDGVDEQKRR